MKKEAHNVFLGLETNRYGFFP